MGRLITGVDIGGTHITVDLIDLNTGLPVPGCSERRHIDTSLAKDELIWAWADAIRTCHKNADNDVKRIGFAMPGPFDYQNGISWITGLHKYEALYGLNVKELLAAELGLDAEALRFINDATAFLLGEMYAGAGKGFDNLVGITLGTGLGSASCFGGEIQEGDLYCTDFRDKKCEDFLSARWLLGRYAEVTGTVLTGVKQLAELAAKQEDATQIFEEFGENLAAVLHHRYSKQPPAVVIIGGNIARAWDLFVPSALRVMDRLGDMYSLKPAVLGEEAALIGASYLWLNEE